MCNAEVIVIAGDTLVDFEVHVSQARVLAKQKAEACYAAGLPFTILFTRIPCENFNEREETIL